MQIINEEICTLAESPIWNEPLQAFMYTDILRNRLYVYHQGTHQLIYDKKTIGAICVDLLGNVIICATDGIFRLFLARNFQVIGEEMICKINLAKDERFNDAITDARGRIIVGTLRADCTGGSLYLIDLNKSIRKLLSGLMISNGMDFSLDNKYFYHTDTGTKKVIRYCYDLSSATIQYNGIAFDGIAGQFEPDGCTIDISGNLLIACWGSHCVLVVNKEGLIIDRLDFPASQITSLVFGGKNYSTLIVTSASYGCVDSMGNDSEGNHLGGEVYKLQSKYRGKENYYARI